MEQSELKIIIEKHENWLRGKDGGECADLHGADLCEANLREANLRGANLSCANLSGANLYDSDLYGANLSYSNLIGANMHGANLRYANLYDADLTETNLIGADLHYADMRWTHLCGADLSRADIREADLRSADLHDAKNVPFIPMTCPDSGSFVGWKKAGGLIVKLLIPEDARRSSAVGRKCRCDKAKVIALETLDGKPAETNVVNSDYDKSFVYEVGKTVEEPHFCEDRFYECSPGIHFFVNRQEAIDY